MARSNTPTRRKLGWMALLPTLLLCGMTDTARVGPIAPGAPSPTRAGGACAGDPVIAHHDGGLENGIAWRNDGQQWDYIGAFGEAFDVGPGTIHCGVYWLTQIGFYDSVDSDLYVWEDGVSGAPGNVLLAHPGVVFENVPVWPAVGENRVPLEFTVSGPFTLGLWGNWPFESERYYLAVDSSSEPGPSWTFIASGLGYPDDWQHPTVAWDFAHDLGIGVVFEDQPVPVRSSSWGRVKQLNAR